MRLRDGMSSVIAFLRAGYPGGGPPFGYAPVLALLPRRICDDEVATIASALTGRGRRSIGRAVDKADVGAEIIRVTAEMASLDDIDRVQQRLDAMRRAGG
jgi:Protein of unknown function (DUF3349)